MISFNGFVSYLAILSTIIAGLFGLIACGWILGEEYINYCLFQCNSTNDSLADSNVELMSVATNEGQFIADHCRDERNIPSSVVIDSQRDHQRKSQSS